MSRRTSSIPLGATLVALALVATAAALPAQLLPGERVRVVAHGGTRDHVARVVRLHGDTLWLEMPAARGTRPDTTFSIPLIAVRRLDRSTGMRRQVGRNAWRGAAAGGAVGALTGAVAGAKLGFAGEAAVSLGILGVLPGAGIGALTGLRRTERWEPVSLAVDVPAARESRPDARRLRPRVAPTRVPRRDGTWARAVAVGVRVGLGAGRP